MKRSNEYARAIRKFHQTLLRRYGKPRIPPVREPIDELMYAVLTRWAPEGRAMAAVERLRKASIDLNDLRVTPVVELTAALGDDFPRARETAEALYRVLNGVFNRRYTLDLSFLKSMGKRDRERLISSVSGIDPHDSGMFLLRCYHGRHVPVSPDAYWALRHEKLVDPDASTAEIRGLLVKVIPASQAEMFACLLKRHIATNPPPAEPPPPPPPPAPVIAPIVPPVTKKGGQTAVSPGKPGNNSQKARAAEARTSPKAPAGKSNNAKPHAIPAAAPVSKPKVVQAKPPKSVAPARHRKSQRPAQATGRSKSGARGDKGRRTRSGSRR